MSLLSLIRSLIHGSPARQALGDERELLAADRQRRRALEEALDAAFGVSTTDAITLGTRGRGQVAVRVPARSLMAHAYFGGPSGCGKSYFICSILAALMRSGLRRCLAFDPKAEQVDLLRRSIAQLVADGLAPRDLSEQVVIIDPYSSEALPQLQVLASEEGLDAEIQAFEVVGAITTDLDQGVGVRQEPLLYRTVECLIRARLPLTVLGDVLAEPAILDALAESHGPAELFRATAQRLRAEPRDRVHGLLSRADRLLRLRATRLALGAPECIDFSRLLDRIVLVTMEPPHGSADIGRFMAALLWGKVQRAIRRRPNGSPSTIILLEEAPAFLAANTARTGADAIEDTLRLARSKGCHVWICSQDLVSLGKLSATLPQVLRNNVALHAIFRSTDDWGFALPVTSNRLKSPPPPWQEQRVEYLDRGAELAQLKEELARLPDRQVYWLDRRSGLPAVLLRTADLAVPARGDAAAALGSASDLTLPVATLERHEAAVRQRIAALMGRGRDAAQSGPRLGTRTRVLGDIG